MPAFRTPTFAKFNKVLTDSEASWENPSYSWNLSLPPSINEKSSPSKKEHLFRKTPSLAASVLKWPTNKSISEIKVHTYTNTIYTHIVCIYTSLHALPIRVDDLHVPVVIALPTCVTDLLTLVKGLGSGSGKVSPNFTSAPSAA